MPRSLKIVSFALVLALFLFGFLSNRLWQVDTWSALGLKRFLLFATFYCLWAAAAARWIPRFALPVSILLASAYILTITGPLAPLSVVLILLASWFIGNLLRFEGLTALLVGLAVLVSLVGVLVFFPVNRPAVYIALLGSLALGAFRFRTPLTVSSNWWLVPGLPLLAHLAVALKPEMSTDGLAMHLAIPASIADLGRFAFDHRHTAWALMPMNGDWAYTAAYLTGGELGARLLNWTLLLILCVLVYRTLLPLANHKRAALLTALMASAPLVQLVTGSMFVENFWTLMAFAGFLSLLDFRRTGHTSHALAAAVLLGAAVSAKFGGIVFLIPALVILALGVSVRRNARAALLWLPVFLLFAAPPYARSYAMSGNPVFPFFNHVFRSPDFDSREPFLDRRFTRGAGAATLYDITFRTSAHLEARPGGWAFQYIVLVPLLLLGLRRRQPFETKAALFAGLCFGALSLAGQSNARYVYLAMPLLTVAAGALPSSRVLTAAFVALAGLNLAYLPASGWLHADFDVPSRAILDAAPGRRLVDELNRRYPREPAAFFHVPQIAGFRGLAYTNSWHNSDFDRRLAAADSSRKVLDLLTHLGIRHVVFPARLDTVTHPPLRFLLGSMVDTELQVGQARLGTLRPGAWTQPLPAGLFDDLDPRLMYEGGWIPDSQFLSAAGGSLTYAKEAGSRLSFEFTGSQVTLIYTMAANRGLASVSLDGASVIVDAYAPVTRWRSARAIGPLPPGRHKLELIVLGRKNDSSSGTWFDIDQIEVK